MNAEEVIEVSEKFNVTAVPLLVLTRNGQVLEEVSGSDATKVRTAIEKHSKEPAGSSTVLATNISNGGTAKNLSSHSPKVNDPITSPQNSSQEVKQDKEDLHKRLSTLVKAAPVMLFMKGTPSAPQCGYSRQLVSMLRENSVKYGFFNILADDEVRQGMKEFADWPTFPQLWVDGELVGGLDIVSYPLCNCRDKERRLIVSLLQVKEELENDPDFLKVYSVAKSNSNGTAPQTPATAAA